MSLRVQQPGLLSLLQDAGRFGRHRLGLTTGGPLDPWAFNVANQLLQNPSGTTALEVSFGGLELLAEVDTFICVTGAALPVMIDGEEQPLWQVVPVKAGQCISLGYSESGCRSYLAVADGIQCTPQFGATATVMREGLGGLAGDKLQVGDILPCAQITRRNLLRLARDARPCYDDELVVRVLPGYQQQHFSALQQRRFFTAQYTVSQRCDRMGYRLEGPQIACDIDGILSEGICQGAIQIPADGQPIVLLNDRQTIGGYPKMGSALSLDAAALAQRRPDTSVRFSAITEHDAHNALHLAAARWQQLPVEEVR